MSAALHTTKQEIAEAIAECRRQIAFLEEINTGCIFCVNFNDNGRGCKLANGMTPPPEVILSGCPQWRWNEIPF